MNMPASGFTDKERLSDVLSTQKFITENYNTFANECMTPCVRTAFMNILNEEHEIQNEVFSEMQSRGWYNVQPAEAQKVQQAKMKFNAGK